MPRYEFDPSKATATIEVFPKGDYEVKVGEPKAFIKAGEKSTNWGVRYPLTIMGAVDGGDENAVNKRTFYSAYMHTDGSQGFAKQFLMAALGFPKTTESEREFNEAYKGHDWTYDPDTGNVGDMWREAQGKRLIVTLDVQPNQNNPDELMQQFRGFRPLETGEEAA